MTSSWAGLRVLVTGHTGFKGSWLSLALREQGASVSGLSLPDAPSQPDLFTGARLEDLVTHHTGDVRNLETVRRVMRGAKPDVVMHLAAQPLGRTSYRSPAATYATNVLGAINVLEAARDYNVQGPVLIITSDKVYRESASGEAHREDAPLGGADPYSGSKAAAELAIASWRASFCGPDAHQTPHRAIATARAGNVIGGGDWAEDRIVPDAMRSLAAGETIPVRQPRATRPWQHVLEPLGGYLLLAEQLATGGQAYASAFNFGPALEANSSVRELVEAALSHWPGSWRDLSDPSAPHEAGRLHLQIDKAHHQLGWQPRWPFATTVERTVVWYRAVHEGASPLACCLADLEAYTT